MCVFVLMPYKEYFPCSRGGWDGYSVAFSLRAIFPSCMALFLCVLFSSSGWVFGWELILFLCFLFDDCLDQFYYYSDSKPSSLVFVLFRYFVDAFGCLLGWLVVFSDCGMLFFSPIFSHLPLYLFSVGFKFLGELLWGMILVALFLFSVF